MNNTIYIFGRKPLAEILTRYPEQIKTLYIREGLVLGDIESLAKKHAIQTKSVPEHTLDTYAEGENHQGVVAQMTGEQYTAFDTWIKSLDLSTNPLVLILDEIQDVHNFGAIIRTAAASSVAGIIVSKHNQAPLSGVVYKTSAGTVPLVPIVQVSNIVTTIQKLKDHKFWIYGLAMNAERTIWDEAFDTATAIVLGNEGAGLGRLVAETCDGTLKIPMNSQVESLNVSVSAAVVCFEVTRKKSI
jgi:23S rRNA (guanosine2251-2'-O)-methyltransferase